MALYPKIKKEELDKIPEEHRCLYSYNGFHMWETVRKSPTSEPVLVCTKCKQVQMILFPNETV